MYTLVFADLVLSNKLVLYDLENQAIGWTEYNCKYFFFPRFFNMLLVFYRTPQHAVARRNLFNAWLL